MAENRSLEVLTQAGTELKIKGETLEVCPFTVGALPKVTQALGALTQAVLTLLAPNNGIVFERGKDIEISAEGWQLIQDTIANNIDSVATIMSVYTRKPKEWFLDEETGIDIEEAVLLVIAIVERHYDFFTMRLSPMLEKIKEKTVAKK